LLTTVIWVFLSLCELELTLRTIVLNSGSRGYFLTNDDRPWLRCEVCQILTRALICIRLLVAEQNIEGNRKA
jgi:hypothetical protein